MNANELADDIKKIRIGEYSSPTEQRWLFKIETMLRQQQAEIEALKAKLDFALDALEYIVWKGREPFNADGKALVSFNALARGADTINKLKGGCDERK